MGEEEKEKKGKGKKCVEGKTILCSFQSYKSDLGKQASLLMAKSKKNSQLEDIQKCTWYAIRFQDFWLFIYFMISKLIVLSLLLDHSYKNTSTRLLTTNFFICLSFRSIQLLVTYFYFPQCIFHLFLFYPFLFPGEIIILSQRYP